MWIRRTVRLLVVALFGIEITIIAMASAASAAPRTPADEPRQAPDPVIRVYEAGDMYNAPRWYSMLEKTATSLERAYHAQLGPVHGLAGLRAHHPETREHADPGALTHMREPTDPRELSHLREHEEPREHGESRELRDPAEPGEHGELREPRELRRPGSRPGDFQEPSGHPGDFREPGDEREFRELYLRRFDAGQAERPESRARESKGGKAEARRHRRPAVDLHRARPRHATVHLSHAHASDWLKDAGLRWKSTGNCTSKHLRHCTSLDSVRTRTVAKAVELKRRSRCPITVTGGTEAGHASGRFSHGNGYKLDISHNQCIDRYITKNNHRTGVRSDGATLYRSPSGDIFADEGDHWDILFR